MSDFGSECDSENREKTVPEESNCAETVFEDPVVKIFRGFQNVPQKAIQLMKYIKHFFFLHVHIHHSLDEITFNQNIRFDYRDLDITYKDLSALNDEDLALFGISDPFTRTEILSKLANTPNQEEHYDR